MRKTYLIFMLVSITWLLLCFSGCTKTFVYSEPSQTAPWDSDGAENVSTSNEQEEMIEPGLSEQAEENVITENGVETTDGQEDEKKTRQIGADKTKKHPKPTLRSALVITKLMLRAEQQMELGKYDDALTTAERAIRIDTTNASLWNLLARIYMNKGDPVQAEQMAKKSNLFAKGDKQLIKQNNEIITETSSYEEDVYLED
ncbi:tetratricopeptide repeat protein [Desulfobacterales bacterium HSG16]|nr:tetratricopeptide repeat protein [Desulfobacterales bacterium HSG16]